MVIGCITTALNEAPIKRLVGDDHGGYRCPVQVMTGSKPTRSLLRPKLEIKVKYAKPLEQIRVCQIMEINKIHSALDGMHKTVAEPTKRNRKEHIKNCNRQTNIQEPCFTVGDLVLVRRAQDKGHKLSFSWIDPRRVTAVICELVYDVTGAIDNKRSEYTLREWHCNVLGWSERNRPENCWNASNILWPSTKLSES